MTQRVPNDRKERLEFLRKMHKLRNEIKNARVKALKAFKKDSITGKFPGKKQSSNLGKKEFENFLDLLD